jgi:hypothetical protein
VVAIARWAPAGVVEVGAGLGWWARRLADAGVDVVAVDLEPDRWFGDAAPWFPVTPGDHTVVDDHADRCLLLVWPTLGETWPADALERFAGDHVAYVGEGPGGRTGDERFLAVLGELDRCYHHALGLPDVACTCDVRPRFRAVERVAIPTWDGFDDELVLLERA